jgi:FKBP-type peptidyl-prolyl cis-trans isomerase
MNNKKWGVVAVVVLAAACLGAGVHLVRTNDAPAAESQTPDDHPQFKTLEDRFSYAYGVDLAKKFKAESIEINVDLIAEGMHSVLTHDNPKMSADEIAATMQVFQEVFLRQKEERRAIASEKNKKEGAEFLAANAKKPGVIVTKSGLQYKVIKAGTGTYSPTLEDDVIVHYRGSFVDGTEFDSTHSRDMPYTAMPKQLIEGWAEALQLMTEGAKWELYVPAELAYGENGQDPYIGPNAVLIFEVELLGIQKNESTAEG